MDDFAKGIAAKARWVVAHEGEDEPWPAWSTGEILAVALVLGDADMIVAEGFTVTQALSRLAGDIDYYGYPGDAEAWIAEVRGAL